MKKITLILIAIFTVQMSFAQKKSRADRFFEKGDYINAAKEYEQQLDKEGYSKEILQNIATAYYNTFQFKEAYRYLKMLKKGRFYQKDKSYDNSYNFMLYQVLASLGKYQSSVKILDAYKRNEGDLSLNASDAITTIEAFKLKDDDYTIQETQFNTDASEFGAVKIDSTIYFTSDRGTGSNFMGKKYEWTHRSYLDIYSVKVNEALTPTSEIEALESTINTKLHEGNFCFSADGNTIYFSKSNSEKGKNKYDSLGTNVVYLYKSVKVDGVWSKSEKLPFNNKEYSIEHPALSVDNMILYVASNKPGGYGDFDIYSIAINTDGTYGTPMNMGPIINTPHREQFPFVRNDGALFFSSNGHLGLGMMDIFVSELQGLTYTKPVNLGAPINSSFDDFSISYYNDTDGFFASNRLHKTDDDIFSFTQTGEIFRRKYIARFEVKDFATDNYVPNAKVAIHDTKGTVIYEQQLDSVGTFSAEIFPDRYDFRASAEGYKSNMKPILIKDKEQETYLIYLEKEKPLVTETTPETLANTPSITSTPKEKQLTPAELRKELLADKEGPEVVEKNGKLFFQLPPIYFDYDKWNIRADSKKVLDAFALKLEKYKTVYIKIDSHTDSRGTAEYNQVLSEKRAESTRNYLALIGYVNARRMKFEGFGESKPLIDCESKECSEKEHQTNRRSEFEIIKY